MRTSGHPDSTARHALWVGGLLVLLAGLFGMHGLDSHGTAGMETIPQEVMAQTFAHRPAPGPTDVAAVLAGGARRGVVTPSTTSVGHQAVSDVSTVASALTSTMAGGHAPMSMGVAGMCMAFLAVALVVLLLLLLTRIPRGVLWAVARPVRAPAYTGHDLDPPSLISLSIRRC